MMELIVINNGESKLMMVMTMNFGKIILKGAKGDAPNFYPKRDGFQWGHGAIFCTKSFTEGPTLLSPLCDFT